MTKLDLNAYLNEYGKWQKDILLVANSPVDTSWKKRVTYDSPKFCPLDHYNHRNILDNEVVVEFDMEDQNLNGKLAGLAALNATNAGLSISVWNSGNKSVHIHTFFDLAEYKDLRLIKRLIMQYLCKNINAKPDYNLAVRRHLIRAEFGMHEKTFRFKNLIFESPDYPRLGKVPEIVEQEYHRQYNLRVTTKLTSTLDKLDASPLLHKMLDSVTVKTKDDGRERILFILIHALKPRYTDRKEELVAFLTEWYSVSGGKKLSKRDIQQKVNYHWSRNYNITEQYLSEVLEDIGLQ